MSANFSDSEYLDFLIVMKRKARRSNGTVKRVRCTQKEREQAIHILGIVTAKGGTLKDAAEMMGLNESTLWQWYEKATAPESEWKLDSTMAGRRLDMSSLAKHMLPYRAVHATID